MDDDVKRITLVSLVAESRLCWRYDTVRTSRGEQRVKRSAYSTTTRKHAFTPAHSPVPSGCRTLPPPWYMRARRVEGVLGAGAPRARVPSKFAQFACLARRRSQDLLCGCIFIHHKVDDLFSRCRQYTR